jgi:nucleoside-diphosphate-sugar epimerase
MRVAITGGAGRIGALLLEELESTHDVVVLDAKIPEGHRDDVESREVDILDMEALERALADVEAVVHLAAIPWDLPNDAPLVGRINILGTLHVLEAAARNGVGKAVLASSICAVGPMFRKTPWRPEYFPVDEQHPTTPENTYGVSKLVNELQARMYASRHAMDVICLRIAPVWFREMNPFTQWSVAGVYQPEINKDSIWAYVGAEDVVQALGLALDPAQTGFRVYNIGAASACADTDSLELVREFYPDVELANGGGALAHDARGPLWSIDKAVAELGYAPQRHWNEFVAQLSPAVVDAARNGTSDDLREEIYGTRGERPMG